MPETCGITPSSSSSSQCRRILSSTAIRMDLVVDASWKRHLPFVVCVLGILVSFVRWLFSLSSDPYHCLDLLNRGQWLDSQKSSWQPYGCMMHNYQTRDASACLQNKSIIFLGDSVTRTLFFSFISIADPSLPMAPPDDDRKHTDLSYTTSDNTMLSFIWDPYLNSSAVLSSIKKNHSSLLVLGSGLWYLRYRDETGGLSAWEARIEAVFSAAATYNPSNKLVILPIETLVPAKLREDRARTMKQSDVDAMNSDILHRIRPISVTGNYRSASNVHSLSAVPISVPFVFNSLLDPKQTQDGLHYSQTVIKNQANILFNFVCNTEIPFKSPVDNTCCRPYPKLSLLQGLVLFIATFTGPALLVAQQENVRILPSLKGYMPDQKHVLHLAIFGLLVGTVYLADRSHVFAKEQKNFHPTLFMALTFLIFLVGALTLVRSERDDGILNRNQTDEWKGWMQLMILIYHYFGASKISGIYNPIRVLVAGYLFMTGYGHCFFYMRKADYGFARLAQVLIRLNILASVLAYTMNVNYFDYYFSPLVSFWFLLIYVTMRIGRQFNDRLIFLFGKIVVSAAIVTTVMKSANLVEGGMQILRDFVGIQWAPKEVMFRVNLDIWAVYWGMLAALAVQKFRDLRLSDAPYWNQLRGISIAFAAISLCWFFYFELAQESKFTYNVWHPYISIIPIASYVILRNANTTLRSCSSRAFVFVGRCSLETFILQFHFWLAADTKGLLVVIPGVRLRPLNLIITSISFLWISHRASVSINHLTNWFCEEIEDGGNIAERLELQNVPSSDVANLDRNVYHLADRVAGTTEPAINRGFRLINEVPRTQLGLKGRFTSIVFLLWLLNITWNRTPIL